MFGLLLGLFLIKTLLLGLLGRLLSSASFIVFEGVNDFVEGRMVKNRVCCYFYLCWLYIFIIPLRREILNNNY